MKDKKQELIDEIKKLKADITYDIDEEHHEERMRIIRNKRAELMQLQVSEIEILAKKYPEHYELTYTMPYETEEDIKKAQELRTDLYEKFNSVQVYPNGLYEVRITANNA